MKKLLKTIVFITVLLLLNYSLGWSYKNGNDNRTIINDSVQMAASHQYEHVTALQWFFIGSNYRKEWSTPVSMPVFHLQNTNGGFFIGRLGGGQQTKSLHLVAHDSSEWVLRTVDKDVTKVFPQKLQHSFIKNIVQDEISASYPYAQLTIHDLSEAAGVPSTTTMLYYVPDDPALGEVREIFAHKVCVLSPKMMKNRGEDPLDTDTLKSLIDNSSYNLVQQEELLKARLLDILIADWDRHKNQWKWIEIDSLGMHYFYPVPEDRDQAYFLTNGALPFLIRYLGMPHLIGFKKDCTNIKQLSSKVHDFDRYFLNEIDKKSFVHAILTFQNGLTNEVIHKAIKKLPSEIYKLSGGEIEKKLISRRDGLLLNGKKYYEFLAKEVTIRSTTTPELFLIKNFEDSTSVKVYRTADHYQIYSRTFYKCETDIINIIRLDGNDKVNESGKPSIKLKIMHLDKAA